MIMLIYLPTSQRYLYDTISMSLKILIQYIQINFNLIYVEGSIENVW